jgi:transcriptional regulator with XRE-family HTH domain
VRKPVDPALALAIKRLREDRGLTQEDVAFSAALSASALSRIERGQNSPGWTTVRRLAEALDVDLSELAAAIEAVEG